MKNKSKNTENVKRSASLSRHNFLAGPGWRAGLTPPSSQKPVWLMQIYDSLQSDAFKN